MEWTGWIEKVGEVSAFPCTRDRYISENLAKKGYTICPQPIVPPTPTPTPFELFNVDKAYKALGEIFFYKSVIEEGMCAMILDMNRTKSFYTLYQFALCKYWDGRDDSKTPIVQGKISDTEWVLFMKVYSDQNIDLSKEPYRP